MFDMGLLKSFCGVPYSAGAKAVISAERDAATRRLRETWLADPPTVELAERLKWDPSTLLTALSGYVWDLSLEHMQTNDNVHQLSARKAEQVALAATRHAQTVGRRRLAAIAITFATCFVTEDGAPRGGTGVDLSLPQPEFFKRVSAWVVTEVTSAWLNRSELWPAIGEAAAAFEGSSEPKRDAIERACLWCMHQLWMTENLYDGDFHDWESAHLVLAENLSTAPVDTVDTFLAAGTREHRSQLAQWSVQPSDPPEPASP